MSAKWLISFGLSCVLLFNLQPNPSLAAGAPATAIFAGGCFWCMEAPFDALTGVLETTSGYTGGELENPSYQEVSSGRTGHFEAIKVDYDADQVSYSALLDVFWKNIDPLDTAGQFCDKGPQYRSAIFYLTPQQEQQAIEAKQAITAQFEQPVATEIRAATTFYGAEDYHQNYYQTHPVRYRIYRQACGRDQRLDMLWGHDISREHP